MSSITGLDGLKPTQLYKTHKKYLIANKEAIICGWNLIEKEILNTKLGSYQLIPNTFQLIIKNDN